MTSSGLFSYDRTGSTEMKERRDMALGFERAVKPGIGRPTPPRKNESEHLLDVAVVFTTTAATVAALRTAGALARQLDACIRMLVPQVVPYPLPLQSPLYCSISVNSGFARSLWRVVLEQLSRYICAGTS